MPFEAYLLSLRADDAMALCSLALALGSMSLLAVIAATYGWIVSPRMEG